MNAPKKKKPRTTGRATRTAKKRRRRRAGKRQPQKGRRFTAAQKEHALTLVASGGMTQVKIADLIGTTTKSLGGWAKEARANGTMPQPPVPATDNGSSRADEDLGVEAGQKPLSTATSQTRSRSPYAPKDPGQGLSKFEIAEILEYKKKHPSYGPAQLRTQLKRFKGWRISVKAIAKVLRDHGYERVHTKSRPQGPEPQRFEAPRRNALWQADFGEFRVAGERLHLLVVEDDFSRYVVGHALGDSPSAEVASQVLRVAIARHGKPEAVRTDRGGAFTAKDFKSMLEAELIDHIVGRAYHPQGGGKVESVIGTVRRELWDVEHFHSRAEAERRMVEFFRDYNERRAHMGIDGLTPADRFFGRADQVLAAIDAVSRKRQGALDMFAAPGSAIEEILGVHSGAPLEVLRLVIVEGCMELRFCGARVRLGPLQF